MNFSFDLSLLRAFATSAADVIADAAADAATTVDTTATKVASAADAAAATAKDAANSSLMNNPWMIIILYAAILGFFWLVFMRPNKKRRQEEERLRKSIEIGDEITTIGGICGRIVSVKDDETIVIESGADRTKLKLKTWAISTNETQREKAAAAEAANPKKKGFFASLKGDNSEK